MNDGAWDAYATAEVGSRMVVVSATRPASVTLTDRPTVPDSIHFIASMRSAMAEPTGPAR